MDFVKLLVGLLTVLCMTASVLGEDVCKPCPIDNYCSNESMHTCPENQVSPMGSGFLLNCTNEVSVDSSSTPLFSTTPGPALSMSTVSFTTTMTMSLATFDSTKREQYVVALAQALSTPVANVAIGLVTENVSRRRLLVTTIEVETTATVPAEDAESVSAAVTAENINGALASTGMAIDSVTPPEVQAVVATTPTAIGALHEWVPLSC
jgi:hypothetical protein